MRVADVMTSHVFTIRDNETVIVAAKMMLDHSVGCLPVVDSEGKLFGMLTMSHFVAHNKSLPFSRMQLPQLLGQWLKDGTETIYAAARTMLVSEIMDDDPIVLSEDDQVKSFLENIVNYGITHSPVTRDGAVVGVLARHDLLKMVVEAAT